MPGPGRCAGDVPASEGGDGQADGGEAERDRERPCHAAQFVPPWCGPQEAEDAHGPARPLPVRREAEGGQGPHQHDQDHAQRRELRRPLRCARPAQAVEPQGDHGQPSADEADHQEGDEPGLGRSLEFACFMTATPRTAERPGRWCALSFSWCSQLHCAGRPGDRETGSESSSPSAVAVSPSIQPETAHGRGYPAPGSPTATGTGTASGSRGASRGNQHSSWQPARRRPDDAAAAPTAPRRGGGPHGRTRPGFNAACWPHFSGLRWRHWEGSGAVGTVEVAPGSGLCWPRSRVLSVEETRVSRPDVVAEKVAAVEGGVQQDGQLREGREVGAGDDEGVAL